MRVLTVPQPMASLAGLGLLRFVPVPEPTAYRGEVAIVGTPGFDWRPQTEALNERWDRLGTPVELDEAEPRLAFRDDTIEVFEPGSWTSLNTRWVSVADARILAGARMTSIASGAGPVVQGGVSHVAAVSDCSLVRSVVSGAAGRVRVA